MATVSRSLPDRPSLDVPRREARELLNDWRKREPDALARIRGRHPRFRGAADSAIIAAAFKLSDAQLVIAREYTFVNWAALKQRIKLHPQAARLLEAIRAGDRPTVISILQASPQLLHLPVRSGNWGPPMSHAANLGQLEIIKACDELGARDHQYAFDRALLQGRIECARWLHERGAKLAPGIIMGSCETLNSAGFQFLLELGAPLTNESGDPLSPLAMVLETYTRTPAGKHAILELFAQHGYELPDTPIMALHRGDLARLEDHLRRDPQLLNRRFTLREIFPPALGCDKNGRGGMHWTPIDGTTLLHLAIDFREPEVFRWLLDRGADVNAPATIDSEGFGGHTPLFNALVNGTDRDPGTTRTLLERGADSSLRTNVRKFIDWCETPAWHIARNVTPSEWARGFPDAGWVNSEALRLLE
jgi:ankyrin repeat protein